MKIPILFTLVVVAILWIQYAINKSNHINRKNSAVFWDKENKANTTRKVDISNLNYITIATDKLPMEKNQDPAINECHNTIIELSSKKILNLTGVSNTELKLKYGVANLNSLSDFDNNYTILVRTLQKWAQLLYDRERLLEAAQVLEYAMSINTDIVKTYRLLSQIYIEQNTSYKIDNIIKHLSNSNIMNKKQVIQELQKLKNS